MAGCEIYLFNPPQKKKTKPQKQPKPQSQTKIKRQTLKALLFSPPPPPRPFLSSPPRCGAGGGARTKGSCDAHPRRPPRAAPARQAGGKRAATGQTRAGPGGLRTPLWRVKMVPRSGRMLRRTLRCRVGIIRGFIFDFYSHAADLQLYVQIKARARGYRFPSQRGLSS